MSNTAARLDEKPEDDRTPLIKYFYLQGALLSGVHPQAGCMSWCARVGGHG
jgi:hypothetical protein